MQLRVVQSTPKLILEWDPVPGAVAGYRGKAGNATKWTQTQQTRMTFAKDATGIVIQALGVEDEGRYPPSPPPTGGAVQFGYIRYGAGEPPTTHYDDYDPILVSGFWGAFDWSGYDLTNVMVYMNPTFCRTGLSYTNGMSGEEVLQNGWELRTSGGAVISHKWNANSVHPDPGNPAFQLKYAQNVHGLLTSWGVSRVFFDDMSAFMVNVSATPALYPDDTTQRAAMLSMGAFVGDYLRDRGIYVCWNASAYQPPGQPASWSGSNEKAWWSDLAPYSDAYMDEFWQAVPPVTTNVIRASGTASWDDYWEGNLSKLPHANALGKDLIALNYSSTSGDRRYCLASFLLEYDGTHGSFIPAPGGASPRDAWDAEFDLALGLGAPTGVKAQSGQRWQRPFEHGFVWVDPVALTSQIAVE